MSLLHRTLSPAPLPSLPSYLNEGGGRGLDAARQIPSDALITTIEESGLQARGGAGKLCGSKWRMARSYADGALVPPSFVVNAAEGEPGSFKDRAILYRNPYLVLEGALIGAHAIGANEVIIGLKRSHQKVRDRLSVAINEIDRQGWLDGIVVKVFAGPNEYLYGEDDRVLTHLELDQKLLDDDPLLKGIDTAVFIQCVGSREPQRPYCSRLCCTHAIESALHLKERDPDLNVYVLYRDMRTYGEREYLYKKALHSGLCPRRAFRF